MILFRSSFLAPTALTLAATPAALASDYLALPPANGIPLSIAGLSADDTALQPSTTAGPATPGAATGPAPSAKRWGDANSFAFNLSLGYANDFEDIGIVPATIGVSWFPVRLLSIDLDAEGTFVSQPGDNAVGGGLALTLRWHFLDFETWTVYGDLGVGFLALSEPVPPGASDFVFTPRAGVGCSFELDEKTRLLTGVRWFHISNAQTASSNPGVNALEGYVGISFGF
jgi:hypothetical protein